MAEAEQRKRAAKLVAEECNCADDVKAEERRIQQEFDLKKMKLEYKLAKLQNAGSHDGDNSDGEEAHATPCYQINLGLAIKQMPKFAEHNVDEYLVSFEKAAAINEWPENRWAALLYATLTGKGLQVFSELPIDDCSDYTKLKAALLDAYHVVPEVHRSRFHNLKIQGNETYSEFAFTLGLHFK